MTEKISQQGLTTDQAKKLQEQFGKNELSGKKKESFLKKVFHIICEPMFLLLIVASVIYFILGEPRDGAIMLIFVIGIISIDIIQEWKTDKTLNALKDLSAPHIKVVRDGLEKTIISSDLVPNDLMIIEEGVKVPADGIVVKASDLCIDESSLTGEFEGVFKLENENYEATSDYWKKDQVYAGTLVTQGSGFIKVTKIGKETEYGKIGENVAKAEDKPMPLQKQTGKLVKLCAGIAGLLFALVGLITFFNVSELAISNRIIESILSGITLAMAMIPEEFPVILTVFLSMGAWRLAKKDSLVKKLPAVETLGAVSVLCVDKTGTITMNKMTVTDTEVINFNQKTLNKVMGMACETDAYDPMEKAMIKFCENSGLNKETLFNGELIKEYAFTNENKMMGHIWKEDDKITVCAKGSSESILKLCEISKLEREKIDNKILELSKKGLRVIAVAKMNLESAEAIPDNILDCKLTLCGLVGLMDPPRPTVAKDIAECVKAKIRVVMITGDNGVTASSIARQIGMPNCDKIITGEDLNSMTDEKLKECVKSVSVFSRVIPEHKMRIVKAFQANGEVVAMTGDGVNDAPALKHADIGIAMGKRGSEVSREAADLILMDDNFTTIVQTIKDGRRIYQNIKKAIGYVFSIHIPIALASLLAPLLKIAPSNLMLLPLHVVLLELVIDPTCSVVLERQPAENNIMEQKPRNTQENILTKGVLFKSIIQGLIIFIASFGIYLFNKPSIDGNAEIARSMALAVLLFGNLFLVQVNSSNSDFAIVTLKKLIKDKVMWIVNIATILLLIGVLYTPLNSVLKLAPISFLQLSVCFLLAFVSVVWYELVKLVNKIKNK